MKKLITIISSVTIALAMVLVVSVSSHAISPHGTISSSASSCNAPCSVTITWRSNLSSFGGNGYIEQDTNGVKTQLAGTSGVGSESTATSVTANIAAGTNKFTLYINNRSDNIVDPDNFNPITNPITVTGTTNPLTISNLNVSVTINDATVKWDTNIPADSFVDYGVDHVNKSLLETQHSIVLPNLKGGTTYQYRVTSKDANGNTISSSQQSFTTNAPSSGGSSSTTSTPTPTANGSTSTATSTTTSGSPATTTTGGTSSNLETVNPAGETTITPEPTQEVLGTQTENITSTPTPVAAVQGAKTTSSLPLGFIIAITAGFLGALAFILQGIGLIKIGFLEKVIHVIFRIH